MNARSACGCTLVSDQSKRFELTRIRLNHVGLDSTGCIIHRLVETVLEANGAHQRPSRP